MTDQTFCDDNAPTEGLLVMMAAQAAEMLRAAEGLATLDRGGDTVYGFFGGIYPTDRPLSREDMA